MYAIDAFYIVDIFISFISAYEGHNKNLHTDFKEIAINYYGTWLPVDVLSIIPFDLIFIYSIPFLNLSDSYNRIFKSLKFVYIQKLFDQIEDYLIYIRIKFYKGNKKDTYAFKKHFMLFTFAIKFVLVCHIIACIWLFIGYESMIEAIETSSGSLGYQNWLSLPIQIQQQINRSTLQLFISQLQRWQQSATAILVAIILSKESCALLS